MTQETYSSGNLASSKSKYYSYSFEKETFFDGSSTTNREINYIFAPDGICAVFEKI